MRPVGFVSHRSIVWSSRTSGGPNSRSLKPSGGPIDLPAAPSNRTLGRFDLSQLFQVANMPTAAAAITAVASQPSILSQGNNVNWPMTRRRDPISMIMTMIGNAAMPLITALQNSALIGSIGDKLRAAPITVAMAIVP
jgi:hypothetical protein